MIDGSEKASANPTQYSPPAQRPWLWRGIWLLAIAAIGVALYVIQSTWGRVTLRVALHQGDVVRYHASLDVANVTKFLRSERYSKIEGEFELQFTVTGVEDSGAATIDAAITVEHNKVEHRPIWPSDFEYASASQPPGTPPRVTRAQLQLGPNGTVTVLRNGKPADDPPRATVAADGVTAFPPEELTRICFEHVFVPLPPAPVKNRDRWTSESTRDLVGLDQRAELAYWVTGIAEGAVDVRIDGAVTFQRPASGAYHTGDPKADALFERFADEMKVERSAISGSARLSLRDGLTLDRTAREDFVLTTQTPDGDFGEFKQIAKFSCERR